MTFFQSPLLPLETLTHQFHQAVQVSRFHLRCSDEGRERTILAHGIGGRQRVPRPLRKIADEFVAVEQLERCQVMLAALICVVNLSVDLLIGVIDPRIRQ